MCNVYGVMWRTGLPTFFSDYPLPPNHYPLLIHTPF